MGLSSTPMTSTDTKALLRSVQKIYTLKDWRRTGWLHSGVDELDCESIAAHSFGVALLAVLLRPDLERLGLDWEKVYRLALIHDIGESIVGDITPRDGITREDKHRQELAAIDQILGNFNHGDELKREWLEFENDGSAEGRLIKQLDKLDMLIQAELYEQSGHELDEFFADMDPLFSNSALDGVYRTLIEMRAERKGQDQE